MVVVPRSLAVIVSIRRAVREDDVEMVSVRLERDRVRVVACVDPERERARTKSRPDCRLSAGAGEHQENGQLSRPGRIHGSRGSTAPVNDASMPNAFGRATAGPERIRRSGTVTS